MGFAELKQWNEWHEILSEKEAERKCHKCKGKYDARKYETCPYCGEK